MRLVVGRCDHVFAQQLRLRRSSRRWLREAKRLHRAEADERERQTGNRVFDHAKIFGPKQLLSRFEST